MDKTNKLGTEPYKGVRDFYPEDWAIQTYIFAVWQKTAESFGYVEYNASPLEPTELYKAKSGEEIINEQTYSFKDRGDRDVTLRPEMTPTVARMIAGRRREMKFPQRWFSIPNLFRYERPQRGRLREHYQLNCDIFGVAGIEAEVEMITLAYNIMKNFGLKEEQFEIRVNSRKVLEKEMNRLGLDNEQSHKLQKLLDKKHKIKNFDEEAEKITGKKINLKIEPDNELKSLCESLKARGVSNVSFDQDLVRGFDYYTGIVFEIYDTNPENPRAIFGGGRYDNLLSIFGEEPVPTVGFGMGDVTIRDVIETYGLLPKKRSSVQVAILPFEQEHVDEASKLAETLRKIANVSIDFSEKKLTDKITNASRQAIPFIIVVGEDEVKSKVFKLKNLKTREEQAGNAELIYSILLGTIYYD